jgi:anaerobic magnesium-protoporphyrin IX monomethyl ester cyclase
MNILLLSMPDSFEHMPTVGIRMPNGALSSLAGNVDAHHRVTIGDLILAQRAVRATVERLVRESRPRLVGLSVMSFQRGTALRVADLVRRLCPGVAVVVGGYDPSLAVEAYTAPASGVDFVVRGEGELTFRDLVRALEQGGGFDAIPGLSYRDGEQFRHNADRPVHGLVDGEIRPPNRAARALAGYTFLGRQVDVVETSRGCTFDCSFCSIIEMRGRNFHRYTFDRVLADIRDAREHGARAIFLVDDNITLDVARFSALGGAIVVAGRDDLHYLVQAMTSAIASHGASLAPLMRRAGFRYVFLGIENILDDDLRFLKARAKNALRADGRTVGNATTTAIEHLRRHGLYVVGGLILGNPDDTLASIEANLAFARRYVDYPYIQHPTPYPRTPMNRELRERGLIASDDVQEYDGTTAVVRTEHVAADEIEFMRWRAERWMKVRHIGAVLRMSPRFVLANWRTMLAHTFRGGSFWKALVGLEDDRRVFARYRAIRRAERQYL